MENGFLKQTAQDFDMSLEEVKRIHETHPETFYEELENYIQLRSKSC